MYVDKTSTKEYCLGSTQGSKCRKKLTSVFTIFLSQSSLFLNL